MDRLLILDLTERRLVRRYFCASRSPLAISPESGLGCSEMLHTVDVQTEYLIGPLW